MQYMRITDDAMSLSTLDCRVVHMCFEYSFIHGRRSYVLVLSPGSVTQSLSNTCCNDGYLLATVAWTGSVDGCIG